MSVIKLASRNAGGAEVREFELSLLSGQILVNLDCGAENEVQLISGKTRMRLISHRRNPGSGGTVFVFSLSGELIVLQGSVIVSKLAAKDQPVNAGEQLRGDAGEVTKLPLDAPERKLWP